MYKISKAVRKGVDFTIRATRERCWDIVATRKIYNTFSEAFEFSAYSGLTCQAFLPEIGTVTLTISYGQLPNYETFALHKFVLAKRGPDYLYIPMHVPIVFSGTDMANSGWGYVVQGVLEENVDTPVETTYNVFVDSAQSILFSTAERVDGFVWCGTAVVPAHTRNLQYEVNFDVYGGTYFYQTTAFLYTAGCYMQARYQLETADYVLTMNVIPSDLEGTHYLAAADNGAVGTVGAVWLIECNGVAFSGGTVEVNIAYWVKVVCQAGTTRLYVLADNKDIYNLDSLPSLENWELAVSAEGVTVLAPGDFFLSSPQETQGWYGTFNLGKTVLETVSATGAFVKAWEPLTKIELLTEA